MPRKYDTKIVDKVLFLPVTAFNPDGQKETRFLRKSRVEYIYSPQDSNSIMEKWEPKRFLD